MSEKTSNDKEYEKASYKLRSHLLENYRNYRKMLLGRVLTIIDGVVDGEGKNKATKDLIHMAFAEADYNEGDIRSIVYDFIKRYLPEELPNTKGSFRGVADSVENRFE